MKLDVLLARARYLAIVLPVFALVTTIHGGCSSGAFYYYGKGAGRTASSTLEPGGPGSCVVYRKGTDESGTDGYFGPCNDDGDVYGGSSGSGP